MTVGELVARLRRLDQDAIVAFDNVASAPGCDGAAIVDEIRVVDDVVVLGNCDDAYGRAGGWQGAPRRPQ